MFIDTHCHLSNDDYDDIDLVLKENRENKIDKIVVSACTKDTMIEALNYLDKYDDVLREIPRVRKDMGYPPLVTPLSQMVGTQAVLNIISGKRYRIVAKEIKDYLRGRYGKYPSPVNEEIKKKIIGNESTITCRPADLLKPEFEDLKEKYKDIARSDEDVLSLALFESVATEFLKKKYHQEEDEIIEFDVEY